MALLLSESNVFYFSCLFAKAWTACAVLDRSCESSNPFVSFCLSRKQFSFSIQLFRGTLLYQLEDVLVCWEFLLWMSWLFIRYFFACIEVIICFFSFILWKGQIKLVAFQMLDQPCIPGTTLFPHDIPVSSYSFIYYWIQFAVILLRIFASISMKDIDL